jgi:hypothetical protein
VENINALDYYNNPKILKAINVNLRHIKNGFDREDCQQEIFAELYDFMPLDEEEAIRLVDRVAYRFKYNVRLISENEIGYDEAGLA